MNRSISAFVVLFVALLASTSHPAAQTTAARVSITALDSSGARVEGAQIQLTPSPYPAPKSMETGEDGSLSLDLQPGTYRLTATRVGFFDFVNEIDVKPSSDLQKFTIQLEPAPGAHTVVHAAPPKDSLRISVAPYHNVVSYKPADLASLPRTTVTIHNSHANSDETYSGVRLADLLARLGAPLGKDLRGAALTECVLATGADNYRAVFTLAEIDPAFHPGEIIVADTLNGHPLGADSGPFRLIVSEDKRQSRCVRKLVSIELKSID